MKTSCPFKLTSRPDSRGNKKNKRGNFSPSHPQLLAGQLADDTDGGGEAGIENGLLLRHPSVQTTCSGSFWCTVVCTLVRLCMEEHQQLRDEQQGQHDSYCVKVSRSKCLNSQKRKKRGSEGGRARGEREEEVGP
uniref:Uncharacterized protein n=1 Tax=Cyprinodon variegatus TaxID=28743 RepID=A0A3Q2DPE3_CYPVA